VAIKFIIGPTVGLRSVLS